MSIKIIKRNKRIIEIILFILILPLLPILIKFIYNLGEYLGIFIRNIYQIICF